MNGMDGYQRRSDEAGTLVRDRACELRLEARVARSGRVALVPEPVTTNAPEDRRVDATWAKGPVGERS